MLIVEAPIYMYLHTLADLLIAKFFTRTIECVKLRKSNSDWEIVE